MAKGQSLIFEQVMLFGISVSIFLILFSVFSVYQKIYLDVGSLNHLDEVKEWISANILKIAEKKESTSFLIIPVPRYMGDSVYEIRLEESGLTVRNILTDDEKVSSLYTLNRTFSLSGTVNSIKGKITIKKEGNKIIIV
jgi:hypothetical protein